MIRKEYIEILRTIRTSILMLDNISRETQREATEVVAKALIKRVRDKK